MTQMEDDERINISMPEGNKSFTVERAKYNQVKSALLSCLRAYGQITFKQVTTCVNERLSGTFDGSINWHLGAVKHDLEMRGVIRKEKDATSNQTVYSIAAETGGVTRRTSPTT